MRALEPDRLVSLESGLWVLDARQPVAAVIDPATGEQRRLVSWGQVVPPTSFDPEETAIVGDGTSLWWQSVGGQLVCVGIDGVVTAVRLRRAVLRAAYDGVAWAARWRRQVIVETPADPRVAEGPRPGWLVRIDRSATKRRIETPGPVVAVHADASGTWVLVETPQARLVSLGVGYDLGRETAWLRVPVAMPERLTFAEHGVETGPKVVRSGTADVSWCAPPDRHSHHQPHSAVVAEGLQWCAGWPVEDELGPPAEGEMRVAVLVVGDDESDERGTRTWPDPAQDGRMCARPLRITAYDDDRQVLDVDPGPGSIRAIEPVQSGIALSVRRPGPGGEELVPVLRVDSRTGAIRVLLDDPPPIDGLGWPLASRPLDAADRIAEARRLCAGWSDGTGRLPSEDMSDARAEVVGEWPYAAVVIEFRHPVRPGNLLRAEAPVFDELGRPRDLEDDWFELWENLETGHLPSAGYAVDGVLEIGWDAI